MPTILYTVRATCPSIQVRGRFLSWLTPSHVLQVMAGGSTAVRIVLPDRESDSALGKLSSRPSPIAFNTSPTSRSLASRISAKSAFTSARASPFRRAASAPAG